MINASNPRMTASVTIAPITPATAFDIPLLDEVAEGEEEEVLEFEPEPDVTLAAQAPVLLPHA